MYRLTYALRCCRTCSCRLIVCKVDIAENTVVTCKYAVDNAHVYLPSAVTDNEALKAPFIAKNSGTKSCVRTAPAGTYTVEGGHNTCAITLGNRKFKRRKINLTDSLLVGKGTYTVTVGLLVVKSKVLHIYVAALRLNTDNLPLAHHTADEAVLGVVLPVSCRVRGSMNVGAGTVNTGDTCVHHILTHKLTNLKSELIVIACRKEYGAGEGECIFIGIKILDSYTERTVLGKLGRLCNACNLLGAVVCGTENADHLVKGKLIEKSIPCGMIVFKTLKVDKVKYVILTVERHLYAGLLNYLVVVGKILNHLLGQAELGNSGGVGCIPIASGEIGNGLILISACVKIPIGIVKLIGYSITGNFGNAECFKIITVKAEFLNKIGVTLAVHSAIGVFRSISLCGKNAVNSLMSILSSYNIIVACLTNIGLMTVSIVGLECIISYYYRNIYALTGLKLGSLCIANKINRCLLNAILLVMLGIRLLNVDLHRVSAVCTTCVLNGKRNYVIAVVIKLYFVIAVFKAGVCPTVTEGECNLLGVAPIGCGVYCACGRGSITYAHNSVLISGLIVLIANVNTLKIYVVCTLITHLLKTHRGCIGEQSCSCRCRVRAGVHKEGVYKVTRGSGISNKNLTNLVKTLITCLANPHTAIDIILELKKRSEPKVCGSIKKDYYLLKGSCLLKRDNLVYHISFFLAQIKVITAGSICTTLNEIVNVTACTLCALTGENDNSRVTVRSKGILYRGGVHTPGNLVNANVKGSGVALTLTRLIEVPESVVYRKACTCKRLFHISGATGMSPT